MPPTRAPAWSAALTAFMPQSRGCRVRLREEVLSGVEEVLLEGVADLAISGFSIPGYLGAELSDVEFVAVAHPEHPLHRLNRELNFQDLESQLQVVIRDSGRRQPRDVGWLGAEQRWTVGSLATAATFVGSGLEFAWLPRHDRTGTQERHAQGAAVGPGRQPQPEFLPVFEQGKTARPGDADSCRAAAHVRHRPLDAPFAAPEQA